MAKMNQTFYNGIPFGGTPIYERFENEEALSQAGYTPEITADASSPVPRLESGTDNHTLWTYIAKLFRNMRWMNARVGTSDLQTTNKDVSGAINELNNTLGTSGDINITLVNSYNLYRGGVQKRHGMVFINAGLELTEIIAPPTGFNTIFTLPNGARPSKDISIICALKTTECVVGRITTSGEVQLFVSQTIPRGDSVVVSASFVAS